MTGGDRPVGKLKTFSKLRTQKYLAIAGYAAAVPAQQGYDGGCHDAPREEC